MGDSYADWLRDTLMLVGAFDDDTDLPRLFEGAAREVYGLEHP
jgi:L-fuconolactonase